MGKNNSKLIAICDAGPIIHLDELNSLHLLTDFYPLIISESVYFEIIKHRPYIFKHNKSIFKVQKIDTLPDPNLLTIIRSFSLDKGEQDSLLLLKEYSNIIFFTDDTAARLAGESLGYRVHGTIGIILRAIRKSIKSQEEIIILLNQIPEKSSLFIKPSLLKSIIDKVKNNHN